MKFKFTATILPALILMLPMTSSFAEEGTGNNCTNASIEVDDMGNVSKNELRAHIEKVTAELGKMRHGRGSHLSYNRKSRLHLNDMQDAMQALHDKMYIGGCADAKQNASMEARLMVMEKNLKEN